jgi:hypothetical protein
MIAGAKSRGHGVLSKPCTACDSHVPIFSCFWLPFETRYTTRGGMLAVDLGSLLPPGKSPVCVFSHPNHEAAVLGMIARLRPSKLIYLTDGGGEGRVSETRSVLETLDLVQNAIFFERTEQRAYQAILKTDVKFLRSLIALMRRAVDEPAPLVFCDAVEFYNPVHDLALPLSRAAWPDGLIFEVPLARQVASGATVLQKPAPQCSMRASCLRLNDHERRAKASMVAEGYPTLRLSMGSLIDADSDLFEIEWFMRAREWPVHPPPGEAVRYDDRGKALVASGVFQEAIGFENNYLPLIAKLFGQADA